MHIVRMKQRLLDEPASKRTRQTVIKTNSSEQATAFSNAKKKHLYASWSSALSSLPRLASLLYALPCYWQRARFIYFFADILPPDKALPSIIQLWLSAGLPENSRARDCAVFHSCLTSHSFWLRTALRNQILFWSLHINQKQGFDITLKPLRLIFFLICT